MTNPRDAATSLIALIRALPARAVSGDQPRPHNDSHSYAKHAEDWLRGELSAADLAWAVAGLAICFAEATDHNNA